MKKKSICRRRAAVLALLILSNETTLLACDACKKQQPKVFQGITHGAGPDGMLDYVIIMVMAFITIFVLYASVKCIYRPAENDRSHIKRLILKD